MKGRMSGIQSSDSSKAMDCGRAKAAQPRILTADDSVKILDCVAEILGKDYDIVGSVSNGGSVCAEVERLRPDLIILDISMGEYSGIDVARQLQEQGYSGHILFLTVHEDIEFVNAAFGAGGHGYVLKTRMIPDLELAVYTVLSNRTFISFQPDEMQMHS